MRTTAKIIRYELRDVLRSRWLLAFALVLLLLSDALLRFGESPVKAMLGLMNVVLFLVPLASVLFGTMYLYHAREFTELLLAQPVKRMQLFAGLYLGLALPLALACMGGIALPFLARGLLGADAGTRGALLLLVAVAGVLSCVFLALAMLIATRWEDRVKGLGVALAVWLLFALLYDGLVLLAVAMFADYPIERPLLGAMLANPVDLARVLLLLRFDISALLGYTGAVFQRFLGGALGLSIAAAALAAWIAVPLAAGARAFRRKDF